MQTRLLEYELFLNDGIEYSVTNGAFIIMKFSQETEPLHFACFLHAMHLGICDVLCTQIPETRKKCPNGHNAQESD